MPLYGPKPALRLREYQQHAVDAVFGGPRPKTAARSGVVVMPCGSGKTHVGAAVLARAGVHALWVTVSGEVVDQTVETLRECTTARVEALNARLPQRTQIVVATYQGLAPRDKQSEGSACARGIVSMLSPQIIVFDEVHRMPAPTFQRICDAYQRQPTVWHPPLVRRGADLSRGSSLSSLGAAISETRGQGRRRGRVRLGLSATLVRMDNKMDVVYERIGPPLFEQGWQSLVDAGYLPVLEFVDVFVGGTGGQPSAVRDATCSWGAELARCLRDAGRRVIVYADSLEALRGVRGVYGWDDMQGTTPQSERTALVERFNGSEGGAVLVCSKVGDMALDLHADAAVEVTRRGGLEQRTQRAGRCMRSMWRDPDSGFRQALYVSVVAVGAPDAEKIVAQSNLLAAHGYHAQTLHVGPSPGGPGGLRACS